MAEIFNPERFGARVAKHGLLAGSAFDLTLGCDLLDPKQQERVREYFQSTKPGLTVISPPCTLFSALQQLSQRKHEDGESLRKYLSRLKDARKLLHFGTEMAKWTHLHGGVFVFEHPLTSQAWHDSQLRNFIEKDDIYLAKSDQCMYGLKDLSGKHYKKPTGWRPT